MSDFPTAERLDTVAYLQREAKRLVARRTPLPDDLTHLAERVTGFRRAFAELLGPCAPEDVPLNPRTVACLEADEGIVVEKVYFDSAADWSCPALLYRPREDRGPAPAVVVVHGWGHTKLNMNPFKYALAQAGYIALIVDNPFAGEHQSRVRDGDEYQYGSMPLATCVGLTMMGLGVRDIRRAADYLQSREDVAQDRLGIAGLCWGGMQTWAAAALDERFRVIVPVCSTSTYEALLCDYASYARHTCLGTYPPGLLRHGDFQDIAACCAPRPVLVMNNINDDWFPIAGLHALATELRAVYAHLGAADRFEVHLQDTVHDITPDVTRRAIAWFDRYL